MALWDDHPFSARQLQYIVAVADLGGFRRAAEACAVSQPSLSAQVARVEEALGVRVFERGPRGVRVTAAGGALVERARRVLVDFGDLREAARQAANPLAGRLSVGVIPTVCPYLLPDVAPALHRALPDLQVVWSEERTPVLVRLIDEGRLDAAILALEPRVEVFTHLPLGDDPFVLAVPPGHPLARRRGPAALAVLEGQTVLLLEDGHCFRDQALALCGPAGAREADLRATSLATLVQMVGAGVGVTLLPRMAVPVENRRGRLVVRPFANPAPARQLVLAFRKGTALRPALDAVARAIVKAWPKGRDGRVRPS